MATRKKTVQRKAARKKTAVRSSQTRKKVAKKRKKPIQKTSSTKALRNNRKAIWQAYRKLQLQADQAWEKFRADVKRNARSDILIRDNNYLRLLLGECNYMARECMRIAAKGKKRRQRA